MKTCWQQSPIPDWQLPISSVPGVTLTDPILITYSRVTDRQLPISITNSRVTDGCRHQSPIPVTNRHPNCWWYLWQRCCELSGYWCNVHVSSAKDAWCDMLDPFSQHCCRRLCIFLFLIIIIMMVASPIHLILQPTPKFGTRTIWHSLSQNKKVLQQKQPKTKQNKKDRQTYTHKKNHKIYIQLYSGARHLRKPLLNETEKVQCISRLNCKNKMLERDENTFRITTWQKAGGWRDL